MTPFELNLYADAYSKKKKQEDEEKITLAYVNAMWTAQWFGKKSQQPKPLDKILKMNKQKKVMTDEQMLVIVKNLNVMFGGTLVKKK